MKKIARSDIIKASEERVFSYITNPTSELEHVPGATDVQDITGQGVGQRRDWLYKRLGVSLKGGSEVMVFVPFLIPVAVALILIVVWIYLVLTVRKKRINIFHDQMEPELAERRLKMLRVFLRVGGISLVVAIVSAILHNVVYMLFIHFSGEDFWERTGIGDEPVFFAIGLLAIFVWVISTVGSLVVFVKGRRKPTQVAVE